MSGRCRIYILYYDMEKYNSRLAAVGRSVGSLQ
jgi:hypothetical protein